MKISIVRIIEISIIIVCSNFENACNVIKTINRLALYSVVFINVVDRGLLEKNVFGLADSLRSIVQSKTKNGGLSLTDIWIYYGKLKTRLNNKGKLDAFFDTPMEGGNGETNSEVIFRVLYEGGDLLNIVGSTFIGNVVNDANIPTNEYYESAQNDPQGKIQNMANMEILQKTFIEQIGSIKLNIIGQILTNTGIINPNPDQ